MCFYRQWAVAELFIWEGTRRSSVTPAGDRPWLTDSVVYIRPQAGHWPGREMSLHSLWNMTFLPYTFYILLMLHSGRHSPKSNYATFSLLSNTGFPCVKSPRPLLQPRNINHAQETDRRFFRAWNFSQSRDGQTDVAYPLSARHS